MGVNYLSPEGSSMQGLPAVPVLHIYAHPMVQEELSCPQVSIGSSYVQLEEREEGSAPWRPHSQAGYPSPLPKSQSILGASRMKENEAETPAGLQGITKCGIST